MNTMSENKVLALSSDVQDQSVPNMLAWIDPRLAWLLHEIDAKAEFSFPRHREMYGHADNFNASIIIKATDAEGTNDVYTCGQLHLAAEIIKETVIKSSINLEVSSLAIIWLDIKNGCGVKLSVAGYKSNYSGNRINYIDSITNKIRLITMIAICIADIVRNGYCNDDYREELELLLARERDFLEN